MCGWVITKHQVLCLSTPCWVRDLRKALSFTQDQKWVLKGKDSASYVLLPGVAAANSQTRVKRFFL